MSKSYNPEQLKITIGNSVIGNFVESLDMIPFTHITIYLPDDKKTGISLNTENFIKQIHKLYPKQVEKIIEDLKC